MFNEMIAERAAELRPYMNKWRFDRHSRQHEALQNTRIGDDSKEEQEKEGEGHWKMEMEDEGDEEVVEVKRAEKRRFEEREESEGEHGPAKNREPSGYLRKQKRGSPANAKRARISRQQEPSSGRIQGDNLFGQEYVSPMRE